jgi:hypothetical protein
MHIKDAHPFPQFQGQRGESASDKHLGWMEVRTTAILEKLLAKHQLT